MSKRVVLKYPLDIHLGLDHQLTLRRPAFLRGMECVGGMPTLWIEQPGIKSDDDLLEVWTLTVVATGEVFEDRNLQHLGTSRDLGGLVWHVFREIGPEPAEEPEPATTATSTPTTTGATT